MNPKAAKTFNEVKAVAAAKSPESSRLTAAIALVIFEGDKRKIKAETVVNEFKNK